MRGSQAIWYRAPLSRLAQHVRMTDETKKVADLAKDIKIGMLTTVDTDGEFVARPMAQQEVEFDGDLWFVAERSSRKVAQITADPHVGVTLSSASTWISINGTAEIVDDSAKAKQLWNAGIDAWLPQGPEDPSVVLIKVTGHSAEYFDTPGSRIATTLSFLKAKATGQRLEAGDSGRTVLD